MHLVPAKAMTIVGVKLFCFLTRLFLGLRVYIVCVCECAAGRRLRRHRRWKCSCRRVFVCVLVLYMCVRNKCGMRVQGTDFRSFLIIQSDDSPDPIIQLIMNRHRDSTVKLSTRNKISVFRNGSGDNSARVGSIMTMHKPQLMARRISAWSDRHCNVLR
jgi:hypothetical protein